MRCVGVNLGHDGAVAVVEDASLVFAIEAEKDNHQRFAAFSADRVRSLISSSLTPGAALAYSGWNFRDGPLAHTYYGLQIRSLSEESSAVKVYISPHERAHILSSFALSPYIQGDSCYALVWEGNLGALYLIGEDMSIVRLCEVLSSPGKRYSLIYELADPGFADSSRGHSADVAGKLMALAAFASGSAPSQEEEDLVNRLLSFEGATSKASFKNTYLYNVGVTNTQVARAVRLFSDRLFQRFFDQIKEHATDRRNLIISGGCGLNCEWNSRWKESGLFNDVFVSPVTNDSGVAVGAAADAQLSLTGSSKLSWSVYCGEELLEDVDEIPGFDREHFSVETVASLLTDGAIVAWAQGRYEMGPRALGNRSILAAPFSVGVRTRLNAIKEREEYRPIAPVCIEEEAEQWFVGNVPSPHMLYFSRIRSDRLNAVRHVDNTARVQTVSYQENKGLHELLRVFAAKNDGVSVLCNTSLNGKGKGFFNKASDIGAFARAKGLDALALNSSLYVRANR